METKSHSEKDFDFSFLHGIMIHPISILIPVHQTQPYCHILFIIVTGIKCLLQSIQLTTKRYFTAGYRVRSIPGIGCLDGENSLVGRYVLTESKVVVKYWCKVA